MKRISPCPKCGKSVRIFQIEVVGEGTFEVTCDPLPVIDGIIKPIDLVSNRAVVYPSAPGQYAQHWCSNGTHERNE